MTPHTEPVSTFHQGLDFYALLALLQLTKKELSLKLGYTAEQVTRWGNQPPVHVMEYLRVRVELASLRSFVKQNLREIIDRI